MFRQKLLPFAIAAAMTAPALAETSGDQVEEIIVTGVRTESPLRVLTNPKSPRQPLPAHDGADYLKTIPGFSVIRKGGADGDPVFRGMAGSRLSMLVDGETILGGCSHRMDPPTAYIFPEAFDSIEVIKGPQSVQHGPGNSAGVVLFERELVRPVKTELKAHASSLAGSFGRHDEVLDASLSTRDFSIRASATNASQDNYEDGDGVEVHSEYERWSTQASLAWTPDDHTQLELSAARSDGEAAYADRGMDGSKFERDNYNLKLRRIELNGLISSYEAQVYYNYVDHVMDNFSLREPSGPMATARAMNPDRETTGGRVAFTLAPIEDLEWVLGADTQRNEHSVRMSMNQAMMPYQHLDRMEDAQFDQRGLFTELSWTLSEGQRLIGGLRTDRWTAEDLRHNIALNMMMSVANPAFGHERKETLQSHFIRLEQGLPDISSTAYIGFGHNERFPDYWETIAKESASSVSAFDIKPEENNQLDAGLIYTGERLRGSLSAFYNEIDNYILIDNGFSKPAGMMGSRTTTIARNVDARSWGFELDAQYRFNDHWRSEFTFASVRGSNETDDRHLAQLPPVETRTSLHYQNERWSAALLWRFIDEQDRVDIGRGNIAGQDIGPSDSAHIFSLNGSWRLNEMFLLTGGADNLLDETYAEHISRSSALIPGFDQTTRVNEPGRTYWLKAQLTF